MAVQPHRTLYHRPWQLWWRGACIVARLQQLLAYYRLYTAHLWQLVSSAALFLLFELVAIKTADLPKHIAAVPYNRCRKYRYIQHNVNTTATPPSVLPVLLTAHRTSAIFQHCNHGMHES